MASWVKSSPQSSGLAGLCQRPPGLMLTVGKNTIWKELKELIMRGSVMELAIAVISGAPKADER